MNTINEIVEHQIIIKNNSDKSFKLIVVFLLISFRLKKSLKICLKIEIINGIKNSLNSFQ